jgi:glycine cleavage system aminomethyltransferase T
VSAFRLSYVGEQGWELHMKYEDGLAVWDALRETGVMAFGVETYANSRRMEKSLRLQNADLLTQYNLIESDLARPKVKEADFRGKAKHVEYKARDHQPAMLCTLVMTENTDKGVKRYPVGAMPVMDPETGKTLVDSSAGILLHDLGRLRSDHRQEHRARLSALGILPGGPQAECRVFLETYPVEVAGVSATRRSTIRRTSSRGADLRSGKGCP